MQENSAYRVLELRMANLLTFIHNGGMYLKSYSPDLKIVLIFPATRVFQKGTMF